MDATEWDERYRGAELVWGSAPNRWVAAELENTPLGTALDVGCGEGRNSIWLAGRGWRVTGMDFSSAGLERAAHLAAEAGVADRVEWVHADAVSGPYPAGPFDAVVVAYLQLPARERREVTRQAASVVGPGGVLLVVAHETTNLTEGFGGPKDPEVLFSPEDLLADLRTVDPPDAFVVERAERVRRPVTTADGEHEAIDVLLRARRGPA